MLNENTYKYNDVVKYYTKLSHLQLPEKTIFDLFKDRLPEMRMLDIGVGAGRTTTYFAKTAKEYVGIDYSEKMIDECKKLFSNYPNNISFKVCDARSMEIFKANTFDFILFSFNGIDYISHNDRIKALKEIKRVGKSNCYFCFSSHNIQSIRRIFEIKYRFSWNPILTSLELIKWLSVRFVYNHQIKIRTLENQPYTIINDGALKFRLHTYYIKPLEQINQLKQHFTDIRIYSLISGNEIRDITELNNIDDAWLYYLCH